MMWPHFLYYIDLLIIYLNMVVETCWLAVTISHLSWTVWIFIFSDYLEVSFVWRTIWEISICLSALVGMYILTSGKQSGCTFEN